ncbi:EamA family transporter [Pseudochelatococcus contaminans]|uniref:Drug/metabolite transporter (DMT)-like permease n=1 Tax=Pseudochelatococcus contaminans TaxID=1538103 RepID=A0A7W6EHU1_9HYPH|nr:drug/metabolite transporter (DMT)-like permease [Pseudochelatococcus contaminans]
MNPPLAISLKLLSALAFTVMGAGVKYVSDRVPVGEIVFFRCFFMLLPLMVWLALQGNILGALRTRNLTGHFRRSVMSSSSMFLGFLALAYLPLMDAVILGYTSPLILVILAAVLLKEKVQGCRWIGTGVGFLGVLVMLLPHLSGGGLLMGGASTIGIMIALAGAFVTAGAIVQIRRLVSTETTGAIIFYLAIITSALSLLSIPAGWVMPTVEEAAVLVGIGILGGVGQIVLTMSFRYGDASMLAPFEYSTMLWACMIGWLAFNDWPETPVFIGGAIVIAAGMFVLWRERATMHHRHETVDQAADAISTVAVPAPALEANSTRPPV